MVQERVMFGNLYREHSVKKIKFLEIKVLYGMWIIIMFQVCGLVTVEDGFTEAMTVCLNIDTLLTSVVVEVAHVLRAKCVIV